MFSYSTRIFAKEELIELICDNDGCLFIGRMNADKNTINIPLSLKEFNREAFDSIVEKIVVGEIDYNGNINPNILSLAVIGNTVELFMGLKKNYLV